MPHGSFRIRILKILKLKLEKRAEQSKACFEKFEYLERKKCLGFNRKIRMTFLQILGKITLPHSFNQSIPFTVGSFLWSDCWNRNLIYRLCPSVSPASKFPSSRLMEFNNLWSYLNFRLRFSPGNQFSFIAFPLSLSSLFSKHHFPSRFLHVRLPTMTVKCCDPSSVRIQLIKVPKSSIRFIK